MWPIDNAFTHDAFEIYPNEIINSFTIKGNGFILKLLANNPVIIGWN